MKLIIVAAVTLLTAAPLFAQERDGSDARGYITGLGGFSVSLGSSTGNTMLEGGARVAPHVMLFGSLGHYANLQGDLTSTLNAATTSLATNQGLDVTASGTVPSTYGIGGVRVEPPMGRHLMPYLFGGIGVARLDPSARFTYADGAMPDGSTPDVGADITSALVASGTFTDPAASNARMFTLGGGVQVPVARHWAIDAGYRYGRIAENTTLNTAALNTNGMAFGFGYRF